MNSHWIATISVAVFAAFLAGQSEAKEPDPAISAAFVPQIASCWTTPSETPVVMPILSAQLERDGSLKSVAVLNHSEDPAFKVYAEAARRAVLRCAPFNLTKFADRYDDWRELTLNFSSDNAFDPPKRQNKETGVTSLMPNFQSGGRTANGFAQQAVSWDDRELMVMFLCLPKDRKSGFAIGVDFGVGRDQTQPQNVTMMYGQTTDKRHYERVGEYLGFEGSEAAKHLKAMADAKGYLEFASETGHSAFFKFEDMHNEFGQFLEMCDLKS